MGKGQKKMVGGRQRRECERLSSSFHLASFLCHLFLHGILVKKLF